MNRHLLTAVALGTAAVSMPAHACRSVQSERTIHPVSAEKPSNVQGGMEVFRIRYEGHRMGREDRLWPNFYIVEIIDGKLAGTQALIPAHITSCHSVMITEGIEGYVTGTLSSDSGRCETDLPILNTGFTGKTVSNWPLSLVPFTED